MIPFCRHFAAIATIFHNMWKSHFVMNHIDVAKYFTSILSLYFVFKLPFSERFLPDCHKKDIFSSLLFALHIFGFPPGQKSDKFEF